MDWMEGDLVWFDPGLGHPIPGEIQEVHRAAQVIVVKALIKGKLQNFALQPGEGSLKHRQDLGTTGVDDMTQLIDLHEASLLWNLRVRYDRELIYTYAGSILIAVNPYKMFPDSYGLEIAKQYSVKPMGSLPPHLFAIGAAAHAALPSPQVVVISGESGSGKTESTKLVMQYLAAVVPGGGSASTVITEQILEAAPLLEAFGNARTARNDNSSRFGKYLEVYFKGGAIVGAKITQYLLEKSRIVTQAPGERNYHVFYEMLGGLADAEKAKYGLLNADKYFYLNQGATDCTAGRVDWESLQSAMQVLGVSELEREGIIRVLSSVLHLGNVYFHRRQLRHGQEGVEIGSDTEIKWAAHLLQIPFEGMHLALTSRITEARSERLHTPLSIDQALDSRDAFAKALYSGLFNWLVSRINSIVQKAGAHDAHRISILDIFGFEDLVENSFEQLCINYANENLQLYFNKHVFKLEQAEYSRERLEWNTLTWDDNLPVIHLLAKKPVGIFHLLDDESNFPRASDMSFLDKCHYNHALNELYSRPRIGAQEFGITHYAGQVWYNVEGFLDKNRDALRSDVIELLSSSKLKLVMEITKQLKAQRDYGKTLPKGSNGRFVTMKPRTPTVAARFSDSLQQLLQSMGRCNPWFVRCIKPNNEKQALKMDMPCVLQQLRYLGMLDTIQIRQKGYPVRLKFQHFVDRYKHLLNLPISKGTPYREVCRSILNPLSISGIDGPDFQLGASRVFLREALHRLLERSRADCNKNAAIIIQKNVRKMLAQRALSRKKMAAIIIQTNWRSYRDRKKYVTLRKATIKAQSLWRAKLSQKKFMKLRTENQRKLESLKQQKDHESKLLAKEVNERSQIIHLDIPAELAFIFSKIEEWTPIHGDRNLVKVLGTVPGPPVGFTVPVDVDQFAMSKFCSVYCNGIRLCSKREPIISPFLTRAASRDQDFQDSIAIFKLILRYENDKTFDANKEKCLSDYIVQKGISSKGIRDEILVQICNQLTCSVKDRNTKLWKLLAQCLSAFQPGVALSKYLIKFIIDNAPEFMKDMLLRKILRNPVNSGICRGFVPCWLEYRAVSRQADVALSFLLPDDSLQTVAIDSWTTCEEAAILAISQKDISSKGWTVLFDDCQYMCDACGLDFILDLISEKELCPAFPAIRNDLLKLSKHQRFLNSNSELTVLKRPDIPPPEPPKLQFLEKAKRYSSSDVPQETLGEKNSNDCLSRSSALNDRYFEQIKSRSKSLDDLLADEQPLLDNSAHRAHNESYNLAVTCLNDRYHSTERIVENNKESVPRYQKAHNVARKSYGVLHSNKYSEKSEYINRSSAMSDTSEAPSLASHVRRVRVPSQASDVDQFLDDLFSPVLDGSLDELSDARSLAASIRGGFRLNKQSIQWNEYFEAPECDENYDYNARNLAKKIKGGGNESDEENKGSNLDEYITGLFNPIFINENVKTLSKKTELIETIKGGGNSETETVSNGDVPTSVIGSFIPSTAENFIKIINVSTDSDPSLYQQQVQRAFLQSAMAQNLQIQQQLLAQNQALQTLLSQQEASATQVIPPTSAMSPKPSNNSIQANTNLLIEASTRSHNVKSRMHIFSENENGTKASSEKSQLLIPPPPPPPMPPPIESKDPSETRHFLDPYGRAKTVRIGKWRWPPPQDGQHFDSEDDFFAFKIRQSQRQKTFQSNINTSNGSLNIDSLDWDEYAAEPFNNLITHNVETIQNISKTDVNVLKQQKSDNDSSTNAIKVSRKSFQIGSERPLPGSVGKLKLSTEMRQRLEQVTAGHSVRSSKSTKSEQRLPSKLEDTRRLMLQEQLSGHFISNDSINTKNISVRTKIERMERKLSPPPQWSSVLPPAPTIPAPPPPIKPPNLPPPLPPPTPAVPLHISFNDIIKQNEKDIPAFIQRQDRDTFGVNTVWENGQKRKDLYDSWGQLTTSKLDRIYETNYKEENKENRSRSRSRSRDRNDFSESVWDRTEVEGPLSSGSDRERDGRELMNEMVHIDRETENSKNYQPMEKQAYKIQDGNKAQKEFHAKSKDVVIPDTRSSTNSVTPATFRTHMAQKYEIERKRKESLSGSTNQISRKVIEEVENFDNLSLPGPPTPVFMNTEQKSAAVACFTYNRVPWKLRVRKEVFYPTETISSPAMLDFIFFQIVCDVFEVIPCLRLSPPEIDAGKEFLNSHGVTLESFRGQNIRAVLKRQLIDMAREWPLYFSRLFLIQGVIQFPDVTILGVSHRGISLARRDGDYFIVVQTFPLHDLQNAVTLPRPASLQFTFNNGKSLILHAARAGAIQTMLMEFVQEYKKAHSKSSTLSSGARAAAQILNVPLEQFELRNTNSRDIPTDEDLPNNVANNYEKTSLKRFSQSPAQHVGGSVKDFSEFSNISRDEKTPHTVEHFERSPEVKNNSSNSSVEFNPNTNHNEDEFDLDPPVSIAKYSLLQFAIQHFRNDQISENLNAVKENDGNRSYAELVKWQNFHINMPLLRLPNELTPLALECFDCILRYCGDMPIEPDLTEVKCVYTVLMHCHKYLALRDEVYCQLMKQTTANRSPNPDSVQRAWRLLSILAAYFGCSDALRPYLMEHLSSAASDRRRACHGTAAVCLTNLRKTARCGGRKNVPSVEEVTAVSAGRSARRQIYRLPGGAERVVNTRCSTVVADVISELCGLLGIESDIEQQEFSLYCIVQGDAFTMPLAADEYILDVTTELLKSGQPFYLIFCRSVWHFPLKRDPAPTNLYIEVLFNQVAPDYLEGLLLELPGNSVPVAEVIRDMAHIAALLHRAADLNHVPAMKEIKFLLPKPALAIREIRPAQWVGLVQSAWPQIATLTPSQVKTQFLNILSAWHLFGSSFFAVKRIWSDDTHLEEAHGSLWRDLILALNRKGVLFLDPNSHETLQHWPFMEVISTRKVRSEDGALFLDMKVGNLMQQRVIRVQTEQAHEISRLIRQYITMAQITHREKRE